MRVLVAVRDPRVSRSYTALLRGDAHAVDEAADGVAVVESLRDIDYDCVVVGDQGSMEGSLAVVAEVRRQRPGTPVLAVTPAGDVDGRIRALEAGAEDAIDGPASLEELAIRVRKLVVRGSSLRRTADSARFGRVVLYRARREVLVDGRRIGLTPTQYAILEHLLENRGRAVSSGELLDRCWDRNQAAENNPLPSQISRLRKACLGAVRIEAVRHVGYRLEVVDP